MNLQLAQLTVRPFVMVVPEYPEKTEFIQKHLRASGIEAEEYPCFGAYDPATKLPLSGLTTSHPYEVDDPGSGYHIGTKSVCLCVSFISFWTMCSFLPEDYFLFIEWDANFHPDWREKAAQAVRDAPKDFDFLFLGSCCCGDKPKRKVTETLYEVQYPFCNHAQIIAKKAMPTLMRTQRKIYAPADCSLVFHAFPHLKVYARLPRIVDQFDTIIPP